MKRFTLGLACLSLVAAMSSCSKNAEKATEETAGSEQTVGSSLMRACSSLNSPRRIRPPRSKHASPKGLVPDIVT